MAIPFKNNLDISQNQLLNAVLQKDSGGPSGPVAGQVYFNTQTGRAYYYNGSAWVGMDSEGATMTGANIIDAINAENAKTINEARLTVTHPTKASLGLDQVTNNKQVNAMATATVDGHVPTWDGTGGDKLKGGYEVVSDLSVELGATAKLATAQGVKTYVGTTVSAVDAMRYKGAIDASGNPAFPTSPKKGDTHKISVSGTIGGVAVEAGDMIIALADKSGATIAADWNIIQANIDGAVIGPSSATNNRIAVFDNSANKIKDSGKTTTDFSEVGHTHPYASKYSANLTASATQTVTHGLNTEDVAVMIRESAGDKQQVFADVKITGANTIEITMATAPTANQYRVTVIG